MITLAAVASRGAFAHAAVGLLVLRVRSTSPSLGVCPSSSRRLLTLLRRSSRRAHCMVLAGRVAGVRRAGRRRRHRRLLPL